MNKAITGAIHAFAAIQALSSLFFLCAGGMLAMRGGSPYYLMAGAVLAAVAYGVFRRQRWGAYLYLAFTFATMLWAFWETGADFWPFYARTFYFLISAIAAAALAPALTGAGSLRWRTGLLIAVVPALAALIMVAGMFVPHNTIAPPPGLAQARSSAGAPQGNWEHYGNSTHGERFANLDQINRDNVGSLVTAWTYRTGDIPKDFSGTGTEDQNTPLFVDDTVYVCTPHNQVIALDADTGAEKWKRVLDVGTPRQWVRCRGLAYLDLSKQSDRPLPESCVRRIFLNTARSRLVALDADTGIPCPRFGNAGEIDLLTNLGTIPQEFYRPTSAPTLAGRVVVVGAYVNDNVSTDMPSGVVRAFDVVDGHPVWAFDPGAPDKHDPLTPGGVYGRGSPNVWAPMSYDPALNLVFLPTGNSSPDMWGGNRTPAEARTGSSVIALDASTGAVRWIFQTVHHDLWDYDVPMQPTLTDFPARTGKMVPAVIVGTKLGQIFVLDRQTGEPLTKVEERSVPAGNIEGERYAATQPFSSEMPGIGIKTLRETDMWGLTPFDQLLCRVAFKGMRYTGFFDPPGLDRSLTFPGALGGMNWGGISVDPQTRTIFLNDLRLPQWYQLYARREGGKAATVPFPMEGAPVSLDKARFMSILGVPCQSPPFGTMTAVDLTTRKILWQMPLGTVEDTGPLGIKTRLSLPIGMPTIGGSLATSGGLLFFAGTQDYYLRALDSATGRELWKQRLPVGSQGGPMTYRSTRTGRQYVVITAGGARQSPDRGDYVQAFRLPGQ